MDFIFLVFIFLQPYHISFASVHVERIGPTSLSKNCDKPCFQGKCVDDKCRCIAGWGGQQCDRCYGRSVLSNDETEVLTDGPRNYSSSSRCMWIIKGEDGGGPLLLRLDSFVTECSWDHLYVYDGNSVFGEQLAAFSGTMSGVEVIVRSGKAIVYFFSDLAFNTSGFNITFSYDKCLANCSSNGECVHGVCKCNDGFTGPACDRAICTNETSDTAPGAPACNMHGVCNKNLTCICNQGSHGDSCQASAAEPVFDVVYPREGGMSARASHASVLAQNDSQIWVVGGAHFSGVDFSYVMVYHIRNSSWEFKNTTNTPAERYDHSVVRYENKLYMFGGVVEERNITNELWSLDMSTLRWELESEFNPNPEVLPFAVAGHTAHMIADEMHVFYGYSPYQGYVYKIQKYNIGKKKWSEVEDSGAAVNGRFGHSLVAYLIGELKKEIILIYGGYMPPNEASYSTISNSLIEYTCDHLGCSHKALQSGNQAVFRHSASLINGMMIVIGGNGHNESTFTRNQDCYSGAIQQYDVECKVWVDLNSKGVNFLQRYGHSSVATKSNIFVTGGFNGTMLDDIIKFSPADCEGVTKADECRKVNAGVKCVYQDKKCRRADSSFAPSISFIKNEASKDEQNCQAMWRGPSTWCNAEKSCSSCLNTEGCAWCHFSQECIMYEHTCADHATPIDKAERCPKVDDLRQCSFAQDCFSCKMLSHCTWYIKKDSKWKCVTNEEANAEEMQNAAERSLLPPSRAVNAVNSSGLNLTCPQSCSEYSDCEQCIKDPCMWCPSTHRCVPMHAYMISFPYGQCQSWVTSVSTVNNQHACQQDPTDCEKQKTCTECQRVGPKCGWCDFGLGTGLGRCLPGAVDKPRNESLCSPDDHYEWYFTNCSACQCNGHSNCTAMSVVHDWLPNLPNQICARCENDTTGDHCQYCADGFFGDPRNGGKCEVCSCNGESLMCNRESGECYCTTKGVTGRNCNKCEPKYYGDPEHNQPCYYELTVDFIFTFKLDQDDPKDKYVNQINFFSTPHKRDTDVQFTVVCESPKSEKAYVTMQINSSHFDPPFKPLMARTICDENGIRRTYSANSDGYVFGTDANTTFLVKVHNFSTPIKIQISFSQSPPINWVLFFVIFAACFVVLLVVAGLLWMIKLRIEVFRRNQRRFDEIEQMASRPFASVRLELASPRATLMATPISVEPCSNYREGVFTLAVRLPTGGRQFTPHGTSGLAVASALCLLTQAQLAVLQAPESNDAQHNRKTNLMRYIPFIRS